MRTEIKFNIMATDKINIGGGTKLVTIKDTDNISISINGKCMFTIIENEDKSIEIKDGKNKKNKETKETKELKRLLRIILLDYSIRKLFEEDDKAEEITNDAITKIIELLK